MLRCKDNSIYTGIATDLERRMNEHFCKTDKCAKYTVSHDAKKLEKAWSTENRILASKLEFFIKKLTKLQKENVLKDNKFLNKYLNDKIDYDKYFDVDLNEIKIVE